MRLGKGFTEKITELITEIEFALQWQQAIILFAVYRSSHVLDDAQISLDAKLRLLGQELVRIRVRSNTSNIIESIEKENQSKSVFSIADLNQGGGKDQADAYRLLNLHREYFLEEKVRAIFWVTQSEAQELSAVAPDFWAFRHRIVDFTSDRATPKRSAAFQGLTWIEWPWHIFEGDADEALDYRKNLFEKLLGDPEASLMRADLCGEMAGLYVRNKKYSEAHAVIEQGLDSISGLAASDIEARLLAAQAIALLQMDKYKEALASLKRAILIDDKAPLVFGLLAQTNRLVGRRTKALDFITKTIGLDPESAFAWNESGNIYADLGRNKDALSSYEKASVLFPEKISSCLNRCAVLVSIDRFDEAVKILEGIDLSLVVGLDELKKKHGFEFLNARWQKEL